MMHSRSFLAKSIKQQKPNYGFSVVELMVAVAIGSFLLLGIVSVFISSTQNHRLQQAISEVQDKGRYIIRRMRQDIQLAGYRLLSDELPVMQISGSANACSTNLNAEILEVYTDTLSGVATNAIARRDCYFLESGVLQKNTVVGARTSSAILNNTVTIAPEVVSMDYFFAVDLDADDDQEINLVNGSAYLTAADLVEKTASTQDTDATWQNVKAVKINFVVGSEIENVVDNAQTINNVLMPSKRFYQEFSAVIALRNRIK